MLQQELPKFCQEASRTWKIKQLFNDLEAKHRMLNNKSLGDYEKQYLCLLLSDIEPVQMSDQLYDSVETIRVKISQSSLYKTIETLTGHKIKNWRDIIIRLVNKGYRKSEDEDVEEKKDTLLIMNCDVEVSETILRQLEAKMKEILGANKLRIQKIEKGSIVIFWEGASSDCHRIKALFRQGIVSEMLGVTVLDVQVVTNEEQVNLTQWFDNILTTGWQAANELLSPSQLALVRSEETQGARLIDLQAYLLSHAVILLVNLVRENDDSSEVEITLRVYPTGDDVYLPPNFKLIVLSENEVFQEVVARSEDRIIQCQFTGELGEEFTVQLVLGEAVITENFVI